MWLKGFISKLSKSKNGDFQNLSMEYRIVDNLDVQRRGGLGVDFRSERTRGRKDSVTESLKSSEGRGRHASSSPLSTPSDTRMKRKGKRERSQRTLKKDSRRDHSTDSHRSRAVERGLPHSTVVAGQIVPPSASPPFLTGEYTPISSEPLEASFSSMTYIRPRTRSNALPPKYLRSPSPRPAKIYFYDKSKPYYFFTNFSSHSVRYDGKVYPTSEHLFQAFKFMDHRPLLAEHIRTVSDNPKKAFSEARRFQPEVRKDWKEVNILKMEQALRLKFEQHRDLKEALLETDHAELLEDSKEDAFWGIGNDGCGRNELGKALMRLRRDLVLSNR